MTVSRDISPRRALDYPHIQDDLFIIWSGNEHLWPDARRETHFLSEKQDVMRGYALFTPFPEGAKTFQAREDAQDFLDKNNSLRPHPYHDVTISTVMEMKVARGYEDALPKKEDVDTPEI